MKEKELYAVIVCALLLVVGVQPALAIDIPTDTSVGTWDSGTRTYTLNQNVSEGLVIEEDNLTLDGAGFTVNGPGSGFGILLVGRTGVTITNVTVENFMTGIYLDPVSNNNVLTGNITESNNPYGIWLEWSPDNTVTGNATSNNHEGIRVDRAHGNTLTGNTMSGNDNGMVLFNANNNQIYNNNFISNPTNQALVTGGTGNVFNLADPTGGNYWDNWTTPDGNGDGFVDSPYVFTGGQDDLPWTVQDGWLAPANEPPVANAGDDQTVECVCQGELGTQVLLDGGGSFDPDEDPLPYTWTGDFAESPASGATPTVTLNGCMLSYTITLVVNDGELDSEEDTVMITVEDTTPPDIDPPGDITVEAMGPDGVPVEDDEIQTFLEGAAADDDCDPEPVIANDAPTVFLPGDTLVTFTTTDESGNTSTCSSTVTVVEAAESHLRIVPRMINREGRLRRILAVIRFPEGYTADDIDMDAPLVLYPGDSPDGIEATHQKVVTWCRWGTTRVSMFGFFPKDEVVDAVPEDGSVEFLVFGRFVDGQYFYGTHTVRIVSWRWKCW